MESTVINQLKKALACKDDKELRLRVEVLLEILEENKKLVPKKLEMIQPTVQPTVQPAVPTVSDRPVIPQRNPFMGGGEELTYTRPEGT